MISLSVGFMNTNKWTTYEWINNLGFEWIRVRLTFNISEEI